MKKTLALTGAIAMIALHAPCGQAATSYTVTDLGTLPGYDTTSAAVAINDLGDVIGESTVIPVPAQEISRPFLWHAGSMTDISNQGQFSEAVAINKDGQVLLQSATLSEAVYAAGQFRVFNVGSNGEFLALNSHGAILGNSPSGSFLFTNELTYQAIAFGNWNPVVINEKGQMTGFYTFANFFHAALWQNASSYPKDLGTLGSEPGLTFSVANALNNKGEATGYSYTARYWGNFSDRYHAVLFSVGKIKDLGTLGYEFSGAVSINDSDTIVGFCQSSVASSGSTVFVYQSGVMYDLNTHLNTPGWTIQSVVSINNGGQIAGTATSVQYPLGHAVVLNPVPEKKNLVVTVGEE